MSIPDDEEDKDDVKHAMDIDKDDDRLIEVCDLEGLDAIRNNLGGSGTQGQGCPGGCIGFELARNLDFMANDSYRRQTNKAKYTVSNYEDINDTGWNPLGEASNTAFRTTFDGDGYTISHLMINTFSVNTGLFGFANSSARIFDLGLLNVNIEGGDDVGSLVGWSQASITNSYATGSVSGDNQAGGLVGQNHGNITESHATVTLNGNNSVGGLVGSNTRAITYSYAAVKVNGDNDVGGLVGENDGSITNSFATGSVLGAGIDVGGLVGENETGGMITNCYATGNVDGNDDVGGLVGDNLFTTFGFGIITNSYATGSVKGNNAVGGLVAFNPGTVNNSYWLSGSASRGGRGVDADAEKTAEELKSPTAPGITTVPTTATYYDWSEGDWDFGTSDQFPILKYPDGNLIPGQGTTLTGSSLRESLRELEIPEVRTTSSQIFGVSTNNYVVTIFLPAGTTERSIVLRLRAYNPDAEIQIFREGDPTDYFAGKMSGDESLPIVVGENTKLTIRVNKPDTDYTLTFRVEEIEGIQIRVKVFLEGPLQ